MVKKIRCDVDDNVWVRSRFSEDGGHISVVMAVGDDFSLALLTPTDARKLRKQIKKALEAIEGVEEEKYKIGDRVRLISGAGSGDLDGFVDGGIYTLERLLDEDGKYRIDSGDPRSFPGWAYANQIEPA